MQARYVLGTSSTGTVSPVDKNGPEPGLARAMKIIDFAIPYMQRLPRFKVMLVQSSLKNLAIRFGMADAAGYKNISQQWSRLQAAQNVHQARIEVRDHINNHPVLFECG